MTQNTNHDHGHHLLDPKELMKTFVGLLILTIITVAVSRVHLGVFNIPVALLVAGAKAGLVVSFFMGLKYDNKVNFFVAVCMVLFVGIFLLFTLLDMETRQSFVHENGYVQSDQVVEEYESKVKEVEDEIQSMGIPPISGVEENSSEAVMPTATDSTTAEAP